MKLWIDTDIGGDIDDALSLLLAIATPEVEIVGVSTVFQNTVARAKIAKKLLEMGGRHNVKVFPGIGQPFKTNKVFHDPVDLHSLPKTYIKELFDDANIEQLDAVEAMKEALLNSEGDITFVTLGALTNVATLLIKYPEAAQKIKRLYIMGTAIWLNLNEFNISCDPEAAAIVLASKLEKRVVSLDVTFKCALSENEIEVLKSCNSPLVKTVLAMNEMWGEGMILHDPLTLSEAIEEQFVEFTTGDLKVELEGEYSRGKCVNLCDFNWKHKGRDDLLISKDVNHQAFTSFYVKKIYVYDKKN